MTLLTLLRSELRRLTATRLGMVAFVALMTVPVLYGGLYLWGNQNPYGDLAHVPAALVVADTGAVVDGSPVHYGRDVADALEHAREFDWHEMSATAAARQLRTGGVDFVVTLPAAFSRDLASAASAHPTRADVALTTSDANGYLSSTIAGQAATAIRDGVAQQVGTAAAKRFLVGLHTVRGNLQQAAGSAGDLAGGGTRAAHGAASLASGTASLASGTGRLATGLDAVRGAAGRLAAGASSTAAGAEQVAAGARSLRSGTGTLADGLRTLRSRTSGLPSATSSLATGATAAASADAGLADGSSRLAAALARIDGGSGTTARALTARLAADGLTAPQIADALAVLAPGTRAVHQAATSAAGLASGAASTAAGARQVAAGATALASAAPTLSRGLADAASGAGRLATGASGLETGTDSLATGTRSVASGAASLAEGVAQADHGAASLASGARAAAGGAADLRSGTQRLAAGAGKLHAALASGARRIPDSTSASRQAEASAIGHPAAVATSRATSAGSYGAGLAPFFLSLSAWIGSYALFLILRPLSRRAITAVRAPLTVALAGWLTPALLGVAQMVGLYLIVAGPLGFAIASPAGTFGVLALTAATFAAILLLLNAALGSVGQFLGLILMLVQLVTAGGTFPWQTLPAPLAAVHHALPMSYAVDALRQVMYGGDAALAWGDAGVLGIWLVAALASTAAVAARMTRQRTLRDLQPSLLGG